MSYVSLAFEGLVCVLLLAAAVMCWRVDRRLRALRDGQDGLKGTISQLNDAVDRARASLSALDRASRDQGAALKAEVDAARRLSDELRFLTDEGESRVQRVVNRRRTPETGPSASTSASAAAAREPAPRSGSGPASGASADETRSRSRMNSLKALR